MLDESLETGERFKPDFAAGFRGGLFAPLFMLFYMEALFIGIGTILGVIPGIALSWLWLFAFSFAAIEKQPVMVAVRNSVRAVLQDPSRTLAIAVLIHALGLLPLLLGPFAVVGQAIVAPFIVAVIAAAFRLRATS